ncbi:MAG: EAL domain-containing protein [Acidovorax sp.]|uniref:EAL domain-containing protein n=1 Tax=Acidovorax sp. TaxID=1872122 RepID=UPI002613C693|nr:EAL domain-containing protein [Acidovorax sp.]MDH4418800.1 EAL domain-containing protein [Acidovorax sp.]
MQSVTAELDTPAQPLHPIGANDAAESLKRRVFDTAPFGLCVLVRGLPQLVNQQFIHLLGGEPALATSAGLSMLTSCWPELWPQLQGIGRTPRHVTVRKASGETFNGRAYARPFPSLDPEAELITLVDDPHRAQIAFSSHWRARMLEHIETMGRSGSGEIDLQAGKAVLSKGMHMLLGIPFDAAARSAWRMLRWVPPKERGYVASIWRGALPDEPFEFQHRLVRADGTRLEVLQRGMVETDATGRQHGYIIVQDITVQREAEQRIQELANHDEVTGLANRTQLLDRIDAAVHSARWNPQPFLVLSIQVDQVDQLKQAMGYGAGDAMAMAVAARLTALAQPGDTVARIDGGEFAILLNPDSCAQDPLGLQHARAVVQAMAKAERLGAAEIVPGARVGVARFPADAESAGQLLEAAQTARMGILSDGEQVAAFTPQTRAASLRRLAIESGLRHAAERSELCLSFLPQADLTSGEVIGAQVHLQWNSADLGTVMEGEYMPIALQTGLIVMLGDWQRDMACKQLRAWDQNGQRMPRLHLKVSTLELQQPDIVDKLRRSLSSNGLTPQALGVEISEHALVNATAQLSRTLSQLRAMGIELSLGDFGSGSTNLGLLGTRPVDVIKVHRSCVPDVTAATGDVSLTRAIINMAHSLQMKVLAEGVETTGQLALLIANGCDRMEGPVFAQAAQAQELANLIDQHMRLPENLLTRKRERTLLLVDDEPNIVSALRRLFRREGYRIVTAGSGAEGLQRMAECEVDVVLSDQRMPGMTGVEFLRRAKELYPDTVRMVLSGYTELQSITDAINEGAIYRFLTKPWDDERLLEHVREAFAHKELADDNKRLATEVIAASEALTRANERLELVLGSQQQQIDLEAARANTARDMLDILPAAVLGVDPDGTIVLANREAERLFQPHTPLLGESAQRVLGLVDPLPTEWVQALDAPAAAAPIALHGSPWQVRARSMGATPPRGVLLAVSPAEIPHGF